MPQHDPFASLTQTPFSRRTFLRGAIKAFAATSLVVGAGNNLRCGPGGATPKLAGLSAQEYHNMNALAEVFLADFPFDFDLGKAADDYVYGHAYPIDKKQLVHDLAAVPSSWLAALALDGSFTTLVALDVKAREERMLGWKNSGDQMKMGLFKIMQQTSHFLLSSSREYVTYTGYNLDGGLQPYSPAVHA